MFTSHIASKRPVGKEVQKWLVLVDYQGDSPGEVVAFLEYQKLYDGSIRYRMDMSEDEVRQEIVRLLRQKESVTHSLQLVMPNDFHFVRCANKKVRAIDGDSPFDGAGISQVYSSGAIYIRLNTLLLEKGHVSCISVGWRGHWSENRLGYLKVVYTNNAGDNVPFPHRSSTKHGSIQLARFPYANLCFNCLTQGGNDMAPSTALQEESAVSDDEAFSQVVLQSEPSSSSTASAETQGITSGTHLLALVTCRSGLLHPPKYSLTFALFICCIPTPWIKTGLFVG